MTAVAEKYDRVIQICNLTNYRKIKVCKDWGMAMQIQREKRMTQYQRVLKGGLFICTKTTTTTKLFIMEIFKHTPKQKDLVSPYYPASTITNILPVLFHLSHLFFCQHFYAKSQTSYYFIINHVLVKWVMVGISLIFYLEFVKDVVKKQNDSFISNVNIYKIPDILPFFILRYIKVSEIGLKNKFDVYFFPF